MERLRREISESVQGMLPEFSAATRIAYTIALILSAILFIIVFVMVL
jgi:hypothetical protein